jgi:flagellar basal body-associated protein FliL
MGQGASLIDVLIALLQSIVVLLLASGVYIAVVVRKAEDTSLPGSHEPAAPPRGPRSLNAPHAESRGG